MWSDTRAWCPALYRLGSHGQEHPQPADGRGQHTSMLLRELAEEPVGAGFRECATSLPRARQWEKGAAGERRGSWLGCHHTLCYLRVSLPVAALTLGALSPVWPRAEGMPAACRQDRGGHQALATLTILMRMAQPQPFIPDPLFGGCTTPPRPRGWC